jgi:hypothetical protein
MQLWCSTFRCRHPKLPRMREATKPVRRPPRQSPADAGELRRLLGDTLGSESSFPGGSFSVISSGSLGFRFDGCFTGVHAGKQESRVLAGWCKERDRLEERRRHRSTHRARGHCRDAAEVHRGASLSISAKSPKRATLNSLNELRFKRRGSRHRVHGGLLFELLGLCAIVSDLFRLAGKRSAFRPAVTSFNPENNLTSSAR